MVRDTSLATFRFVLPTGGPEARRTGPQLFTVVTRMVLAPSVSEQSNVVLGAGLDQPQGEVECGCSLSSCPVAATELRRQPAGPQI